MSQCDSRIRKMTGVDHRVGLSVGVWLYLTHAGTDAEQDVERRGVTNTIAGYVTSELINSPVPSSGSLRGESIRKERLR